ncbi:MAG: hypothetical protein IT313_00650 [Anaerolineales bacterium]|nr:hypothetical protein [Anaerolineales bacterium]
MRTQLEFFKISSIFLFLLTFIACSNQTTILPTESPTLISASAPPLATLTLSPTQSLNILSPTLTPSATSFFSSDGQGAILSLEQQEEIRKLIDSYFAMRYQAHSFPQQEGFELSQIGNLVSLESDGRAFLDNELAKLLLELTYRELNGSRYVTYQYFLNFSEFNFDISTEVASVLVIEDSKTTSENSSLLAHMSGLKHVITLRNEQGEWKIVSDYYNDFLWRNIRRDGDTKDDILNRVSTVEALITPSVVP